MKRSWSFEVTRLRGKGLLVALRDTRDILDVWLVTGHHYQSARGCEVRGWWREGGEGGTNERMNK